MARKVIEYVVDTNVWVRYLTRDHETHYIQAKQWFEEAEKGQRKLVLLPVVVAETCFVLESYYQLKRDQISSSWQTILGQRWLMVDERKVLVDLWPHYLEGMHFVDSYLLASSRSRVGKVLTFDTKLQQLSP
jgi:predicted nucleic acid-binding protein